MLRLTVANAGPVPKFRGIIEQESTQQFNLKDVLPDAPEPPPADASYFPVGTSLKFQIDTFEIVVQRPETEVVLGRFGDMLTMPREVYPVNLSDYAGYAMGVSRVHVSLRPTPDDKLEVMDLASSNGTFLNGYPLNAYDVYHIYSGDELRLGQMRIIVEFLYR